MSSYLKLDAAMPRHPKIAGLADNDARWAYIETICEAKRQIVSGVFVSEAHYRRCVPPDVAARLDDLIGGRLVERAPALCERCRDHYGVDAPDGAIVVHDFREMQVDPTGVERQRRLRDAKKGPKVDPSTAPEAPVRDCHVTVTRQSHRETETETEIAGFAIAHPATRAPLRLPPRGEVPEPFWPLVRWVEDATGRVFGFTPGSRVFELLVDLVKSHGPEKVQRAFEEVRSDATEPIHGARQYVYGAERYLEQIPNPRRTANAASQRRTALDPGPSTYDVLGSRESDRLAG